MANLSFSAAVKDFADKAIEAVEAVRNQSTQEVVEIMQTPTEKGGRMRVDTGFMRASLLGSTSAMPRINESAIPIKGNTYTFDEGQIEATILGAELDSTIYMGYTAAYAGHREYGARGQTPDAFVRTAAQQWPQIVAKNVSKVRRAFGF